MDLKQSKEKYKNAYETWEEKEDLLLKKLYFENKNNDEISQILKRKPSAIKSRLRKLGL
jgi:DNA-directed RNA polymerase specialized sigma24 family protein